MRDRDWWQQAQLPRTCGREKLWLHNQRWTKIWKLIKSGMLVPALHWGLGLYKQGEYRKTIVEVECTGVKGTTSQSDDYALGWLVECRPINKLVQNYDEPDSSRDLD